MSKRGLTILAFITMIIDHFGMVILLPMIEEGVLVGDQYAQLYYITRIIGRVAFPLFAYGIAEGVKHSKDPKRYILRLFIFAIISEIPFNLAVGGQLYYPESQNVLWTLGAGALSLYVMQHLKPKIKNDIALSVVTLFTVILMAGVAEGCRVDYGAYGVVLIVVFYLFRESKLKQIIVGGVLSILWVTMSTIGVLALSLYNPNKPYTKLPRWIYLIYPVHLLLFYIISRLIVGG